MLSRVWLSATPWTVALQAPLSERLPKQEYYSGLPFPPPGDLPNPGTEPASPVSPALTGRWSVTTAPPRKSDICEYALTDFVSSHQQDLIYSTTQMLGVHSKPSLLRERLEGRKTLQIVECSARGRVYRKNVTQLFLSFPTRVFSLVVKSKHRLTTFWISVRELLHL